MSPFSAAIGILLVFFLLPGHWLGWLLIGLFALVGGVELTKALLR